MNSKRIRAFVLAAAVTALMGSGALAQADTPSTAEPGGAMMTPAQPNTPAEVNTPGMTTAQTSPPSTTTTAAPRNDGFSWGWIGLLGLIGLTGLGRREARPVDHDAAYPAKRTDTAATPLGGVR